MFRVKKKNKSIKAMRAKIMPALFACLAFALCLLFACPQYIKNISVNAAAQKADEKAFNSAFDTKEGFAYGSGNGKTAASAFLIATAAHLDNVRNYASNTVIIDDNGSFPDDEYIPNGNEENYEPEGDENTEPDTGPIIELPAPGYYFKVIEDIDMGEYLSKGGGGYLKWGDKGWEPIASFNGVFDGSNKTIKNLWIDRPDDYTIGLFGYCSDCKIENIRLELSSRGIKGKHNVGGIAGRLNNSFRTDKESALIKRCSVKGNIYAENEAKPKDEHNWDIMSSAAGIAGYLFNGAIAECEFSGGVSGLCAIGGVAGTNSGGDISDCMAVCKITLTSTADYIPMAGAAGIAGLAYGETTIKNCFYKGYQKDSRTAAIVGFRKDINAYGEILNSSYELLPQLIGCYYNKDIFLGGLTHIEKVVEFDNTGFGGEKTSQAFEPVNSGGLTAKQSKNKSSYKGWNFDSIWGFDNQSELVLRALDKAYEQPSLIWLWVVLGCALFGIASVASGLILYRRKKLQIVSVIKTVTEIREKEVLVEVPIIKRPLPEDLSEQEKRVAELILKGKSQQKIANELGISDSTIKTYMSRIYTKTGVDSQKEFVAHFTFES